MAELVHQRPRRPCPICQKPSVQRFHPFCSSRCAQLDLNRWFSGQYAIPVDDGSAPDASPDPDPEKL